MDIATIASALSSLKSIKELGGGLLDAKIDAEAKQRVIEVLDKLGSVQESLFHIREERIKLQGVNQRLVDVIKNLERKLEIKGKRVYEKPSYWIIEGKSRDGRGGQNILCALSPESLPGLLIQASKKFNLS
jgi:hypothetical protein